MVTAPKDIDSVAPEIEGSQRENLGDKKLKEENTAKKEELEQCKKQVTNTYNNNKQGDLIKKMVYYYKIYQQVIF